MSCSLESNIQFFSWLSFLLTGKQSCLEKAAWLRWQSHTNLKIAGSFYYIAREENTTLTKGRKSYNQML
jgi:hypothetical protein